MGRVLIDGRCRQGTLPLRGGTLDGAGGGALDRAMVDYMERPHGEQRCAGCSHYLASALAGPQCDLVAGRIAPHGWCARFTVPATADEPA